MTRYYIDVKVDVPDYVYREAMALGYKQYAYKIGLLKPNYPVPATEYDNLLAVKGGDYLSSLRGALVATR